MKVLSSLSICYIDIWNQINGTCCCFLGFFGGYLSIIFYGDFIPRDSKFEGTYLVLKVLFEKKCWP